MDRNQLSFIADIVGIVTGFMTLLGIGGIFTWSVFNKKNSPLSERVWEIFGYSIKTFLCLFLTAALYQPFWLLVSFAAVIFGDGSMKGLQEAIAIRSVPYMLGAVVLGSLFLPLWVTLCMCIYTWSFSPLMRLWNGITRSVPSRTENKKSQSRKK